MSVKPKNLRIEKSPEQSGTFVTTTSMHEAVQEVAAHCKISKPDQGYTGSWEGRTFNGWEEIEKAFLEPWKEGLEKVNDMLEEIHKEHIEAPEDVRRKMHWSDQSGEINVDRILGGDPEYMRRAFRRNSSAPRNVAILCNVGNTDGYSAEQIFWRGAAAIAAIDLLEEAGYQCEVWCWNHAMNCFSGSSLYGYSGKRPTGYWTWTSKQREEHDNRIAAEKNAKSPTGGSSFFFCAKLKECGDPLDLDRMTNGLSAWFFRSVIFGMREVVQTGRYGSGSSQHVIGKWMGKMDITEGVTKVDVPSVFTKEDAVEAAKKILADVKNRVSFEGEEQ